MSTDKKTTRHGLVSIAGDSNQTKTRVIKPAGLKENPPAIDPLDESENLFIGFLRLWLESAIRLTEGQNIGVVLLPSLAYNEETEQFLVDFETIQVPDAAEYYHHLLNSLMLQSDEVN